MSLKEYTVLSTYLSMTPRYLFHQLLLHDSSWLIIDEMSGKNNQSSNDKRKCLNYSNRLSSKLTQLAINLDKNDFLLSQLFFLMGYRKLEAETSDDLCSFPVVVPLTPATEYFYSQHPNTSRSNTSKLRKFSRVKFFTKL